MSMLKRYIECCLEFRYGLGCAAAVVIFIGSLCLLQRERNSRGQSISNSEVFCSLAFSVYLAFLLNGTLLNRTVGETEQVKWRLFWSYVEAFKTKNTGLAIQMVYNVIAFIPWGILLPKIWINMRKRWRVIVGAALFSFVVEVIQLVLKCGWFELDDVFHNTLGAVIGYGAWGYGKEVRMNKKKIFTIMTLLWVAVIFTFSLQPGEVSGNMSGSFLNQVLELFLPRVYEQLGIEQLEFCHLVLRKCAHFTEFAILGVLSSLTLFQTKLPRRWLIAMCFCVAVAAMDETIQLFVSGRAGRVMDVLIDSSGAATGSGILFLIKRGKCSKGKFV